jgi:probable HAF family extracellular repeat protein
MNWLRLASLFAAVSIVEADPIYALIDLGNLGGSYTIATGVNASGQIVGGMTDPYGYLNAFSSSGFGLAILSGDGQANGINGAGQIAGTKWIGGQAYATVWNGGVATMVGGAGSYALAINGSGDIAGMLVNNGFGNAFVSQNGTVIELGSFAGGSWSAAYGLNDAGQAAGYGMMANGDFGAFVWSPGQGYSALGTLGGANSYAMAINNSGLRWAPRRFRADTCMRSCRTGARFGIWARSAAIRVTHMGLIPRATWWAIRLPRGTGRQMVFSKRAG